MKTCCFLNGNGDFGGEQTKQAISAVIRQLSEEGVKHFIGGAELDFGILAAELVLEEKKKGDDLTLEIVIPYELQPEFWSEKERDRYFSLIEKCDKETMLQKRYDDECIHCHTVYLCSRADVVVFPMEAKGIGEPVIVEYQKSREKRWISIEV